MSFAASQPMRAPMVMPLYADARRPTPDRRQRRRHESRHRALKILGIGLGVAGLAVGGYALYKGFESANQFNNLSDYFAQVFAEDGSVTYNEFMEAVQQAESRGANLADFGLSNSMTYDQYSQWIANNAEHVAGLNFSVEATGSSLGQVFEQLVQGETTLGYDQAMDSIRQAAANGVDIGQYGLSVNMNPDQLESWVIQRSTQLPAAVSMVSEVSGLEGSEFANLLQSRLGDGVPVSFADFLSLLREAEAQGLNISQYGLSPAMTQAQLSDWILMNQPNLPSTVNWAADLLTQGGIP